jgi:hypothetical protein
MQKFRKRNCKICSKPAKSIKDKLYCLDCYKPPIFWIEGIGGLCEEHRDKLIVWALLAREHNKNVNAKKENLSLRKKKPCQTEEYVGLATSPPKGKSEKPKRRARPRRKPALSKVKPTARDYSRKRGNCKAKR